MNEGSAVNDHAEFRAERLDSARKRFHGAEIVGLCGRCQNSHIFKTARDNYPTVLCTLEPMVRTMPVDINECNRFSQQGRLSIWELAKIATVIEVDKPKLGFTKEEL